MNDSNEVKLHFLDYWRVLRVRWGIISLSFLLVVVTAGVTVYFLPRQYFSKVSIQVKQDDSKLDIFGNRGGVGTDMRFAPTQFQIIQRKEILYPVIENLKLEEKWSSGGQRYPKESIYFMLLKRLDMKEVRNTDLIEIGVFSTDPQEAANIANQIAVVYQDRRRQDQEQLVSRGLSQLQEEVLKQRKKVEEAANEAAQIRVKEGIVDFNPETLETVETADSRSVLDDEKQANDSRVLVSQMESQLKEIEKLKPEELMVALRSLNIDDPTILKILPLYQDSVVKEAEYLNSGLGQKHPKVTALRAMKDVYATQLNDQLSALRKAQATKLNVAKATLEALEAKLENTKKTYQDRKNQSAEYIEAKNKYIQAKKVLEAAEMRLSTETMQKQISLVPAKIWEKAEPGSTPAKPNVVAYMALAVMIGLIVGIGLAFFVEYLDTSVKTLEDIERFLNVPVLAVIGKDVPLLHDIDGDCVEAEAYRILRTNLEFNRKSPDLNTITLISGGPGEGKSTTLCNLAFTCAKGGYNVLVVDADLRRPSQHRLLDMDNSRGLTDYLSTETPMEDVVVKTKVPNLSFIPSGKLPHDAVGILNSQRMVELIQRAKRRYDLVFLDSPPILGVSDGSVLASEVDLTIMVVQHRRFPRAMLQRVKQAVINVGGNLVGVVLNNVDTARDQGYSEYTTYTQYYYHNDGEPKKKRTKAKVQPKPIAAASTRANDDDEQY